MKRVLFPCLLAATLTLANHFDAQAGRLSPGLEKQIDGMDPAAEIKVMLFVEDPTAVEVRDLDDRLRTEKATRAVRHREILETLRDGAARSQATLLQGLEADRSSGDVLGFTAHWLVNGVVVQTTVDHLDELAARPGVDVIEPDLVVSLIEPVDSAPAGIVRGGLGLLPGIAAVQADRVWSEIGVDGTGALIGGLDTGVDVNHPALSARWRGNFAPVAECWKDGADRGDLVPADGNSHGTHTMGTMCGFTATDSIGIAPGALWIADNTINQSASSEFDNDVLAALAWFADPDGNPATLDDVPDVVQNSWGVHEGFTGYVDCDSRWWAAIDNCEAAGVVLVWSAGNEGDDFGDESIRSPADRCDSPYNCFSVGSTLATPPYTISSFSSLGPSTCAPAPFPIKPEISAPGSSILSSIPGGGYGSKSGTSMAGPHVAGVVALMRAANPNLEVEAIKQILMDTAIDLGSVGEDNTYGHGFLDAYEAVLAGLAGYGSVEGVVTDSTTGLPLADVDISVVGTNRTATTDSAGFYRLYFPADTYTFHYSAFGYVDGAQDIVVTADAVSDGNLELVPAATGRISGTVTDYLANAVDGALVTILDVPIAPVSTLPDGTYEIFAPSGTSYDVRASYPGLGPHTVTVALTGDVVQDFLLTELTSEDFETGDFSVLPWTFGGSAPWTIDPTNAYEGLYGVRSGSIVNNQTSSLELEAWVRDPGEVGFAYSTSSEAGDDELLFFLDDVEQGSWSGSTPWATVSFPVTSGLHTFRWDYTKDGFLSSGADRVWVDLVTLPPLDFPDIQVSQTSVSEELPSGGSSSTLPLTVTNSGVVPLDFTGFLAGNIVVGKAPATVARPNEAIRLGKDEADPRPGGPPVAGGGGPDSLGYTWIDSDEANGPTFDWVEIHAIGTPIALTDDSNAGPFALGFEIPFHGLGYSSVRVCSNGFLSFTGTSAPYTNDPIPTGSAPNALLAVYWDDLNPDDAGIVYYYADAANDRFIVEWDGIAHYTNGGGGAPQTFQAILNADGSILYQYRTVTGADEATVGVENPAGTDGLEIAFNTAYLKDSLAIAIRQVEPFVAVTPLNGSLLPTESVELTVSFNTNEVGAGVHEATLTLTSNDPDESPLDVPLQLTVTDPTGVPIPSGPGHFSLGRATPNPFGDRTVLRFEIPRAGVHADLSVFDVTGRRVKTLVSGPQTAGLHLVVWDGTDGGGNRVAAGTYFYRLRAQDFDESHRMVRLR
jgi:subtilisin family serine protease